MQVIFESLSMSWRFKVNYSSSFSSGSPATDISTERIPASKDAEITSSQLTSERTTAVPIICLFNIIPHPYKHPTDEYMLHPKPHLHSFSSPLRNTNFYIYFTMPSLKFSENSNIIIISKNVNTIR